MDASDTSIIIETALFSQTSPGIVLLCSKHLFGLDYDSDLVNPACNPFVSEPAATPPDQWSWKVNCYNSIIYHIIEAN